MRGGFNREVAAPFWPRSRVLAPRGSIPSPGSNNRDRTWIDTDLTICLRCVPSVDQTSIIEFTLMLTTIRTPESAIRDVPQENWTAKPTSGSLFLQYKSPFFDGGVD